MKYCGANRTFGYIFIYIYIYILCVKKKKKKKEVLGTFTCTRTSVCSLFGKRKSKPKNYK